MAVAGKFGCMQEFNPELESFETYEERLKLYFEANDVAPEKQVAVFLRIVAAKNYALLRDLISPDKPKKKGLNAIIDILKAHFDPTPSVISERFTFYCCEQKAGESIEDYKAELKKQCTNCKFGMHLDEALRDRFVCGLRSESIRKCLDIL